MSLILHNRTKGDSPYGEKYKSPSFRMGSSRWWKIKRVIKKALLTKVF